MARRRSKASARSRLLTELDEAVATAVAALNERGFDSPYLWSFVGARIIPLRFRPDAGEEFEPVIKTMTASARKFDVGKIRADQIARSGGTPVAE